MALKIPCICGRTLIVPERRAGTTVRCPKCQQKLRVPEIQPSARPQPPERKRPAEPVSSEAESPQRSTPEHPSPASLSQRPAAEHPKIDRPAKERPAAESPTPAKSPPKPPPRKPKGTGQPPAQPKSGRSQASGEQRPQPKERSASRQPSVPPPAAPSKPAKEKPAPTSPADAGKAPEPPAAPAQAPEAPPAVSVSVPTPSTPHAPPARRESTPPDRAAPQTRESRTPNSPTPPVPEPTVQSVQAAPPATATAPDEANHEPQIRGVEHDATHVRTVNQLGVSLMLLAMFGAVPGVLDIFDHLRNLEESTGISRWAYALIFIAVLEMMYAVYLMQVPDWATVWVVSIFTLGMATLYAIVLGLVLMSKEHDPGQFIEMLQLADKLHGGKATGWCFIMLSTTSLLSYFAGRIGVNWHKLYLKMEGG